MADHHTKFSFAFNNDDNLGLMFQNIVEVLQEYASTDTDPKETMRKQKRYPHNESITPKQWKVISSVVTGKCTTDEIDEWISYDLNIEFESNKTYVYAEESGRVNGTADLLQDLIEKADSDAIINFEWANTCSKPRTGEFGGGSVTVSKEGVFFQDTSTTGLEQVKAIEEMREVAQEQSHGIHRVAIACLNENKDGEPDFYFAKIQCNADDFENKLDEQEYTDQISKIINDAGYTPLAFYTEKTPAGRAIMSTCEWNTIEPMLFSEKQKNIATPKV